MSWESSGAARSQLAALLLRGLLGSPIMLLAAGGTSALSLFWSCAA